MLRLIRCRVDIIAMLILGVLFIVGFFLWERHVVYKTSRPPLMRLQLWTRANGRLASVYFIGFVSWMGFVVSRHRHPIVQQDLSSWKWNRPLTTVASH
jgi:hypothetical protein